MEHTMTYEEYLRDVKKGIVTDPGQLSRHAPAADAAGKVEDPDSL